MTRKYILLISVFLLAVLSSFSQTTDLAVAIEAQDLNGADVSQVHIYEEFQYVVTLINSGNATTNVTFSQEIDVDASILNQTSINAMNGASDVTNFNVVDNILTGTVASMPNNSSVQVRVRVRAPLNLGGIATNVNVFPPEGTTDTNESNNQSIISIDVTDLPIDFSVSNAQIIPNQGTPLTSWNDTITYEFTITNHSIITYPLGNFAGYFSLITEPVFGIPGVQFESLECISGNGMDCIDTSTASTVSTAISPSLPNFTLNQSVEFPSGASLTFRVVYSFFEPFCAIDPQGDIIVGNYITLSLNHTNESSNDSNIVESTLLESPACTVTDVAIETTQLNPNPGLPVGWGEDIEFETVVTNFGPNPAPVMFFVQNLSIEIPWEIVSLNCVSATNGISCDDIDLTATAFNWSSNIFDFPVGSEITVQFVVRFIEPECSTDTDNAVGHLRSGINIQTIEIIDSNIINNAESDFVSLPATEACPTVDLEVVKSQIDPIPPEGTNPSNTTDWGEIAYHITISNPSDFDVSIIARDYFQGTNAIATLQSVSCISTTGTATCQPINFTQIGVPLDGIPVDGEVDTFWSISAEDNWLLPAQSSVTFETVILWEPQCATSAIPVTNRADAFIVDNFGDPDPLNNVSQVTTFFAPCVDLVVQTFPEFTNVNINQEFDWIVDITNSETSSSAIDVLFENLLDSAFTIAGSPSCEVTSGIATCIPSFDVSDNLISGSIPAMEAGSTIRVRIPVFAPNYGGAFTNLAEATPSPINNAEVTPETNISISNVQVLAPSVLKAFSPIEIIVGNESTLTFTVTNLASNDAQSNINFTDNLPDGLVLASSPFWVESNGCTTSFLGDVNDDFVGVSNLNFPQGVSECTFAVIVTSDIAGIYSRERCCGH